MEKGKPGALGPHRASVWSFSSIHRAGNLLIMGDEEIAKICKAYKLCFKNFHSTCSPPRPSLNSLARCRRLSITRPQTTIQLPFSSVLLVQDTVGDSIQSEWVTGPRTYLVYSRFVAFSYGSLVAQSALRTSPMSFHVSSINSNVTLHTLLQRLSNIRCDHGISVFISDTVLPYCSAILCPCDFLL